jgi:hypothetical protein
MSTALLQKSRSDLAELNVIETERPCQPLAKGARVLVEENILSFKTLSERRKCDRFIQCDHLSVNLIALPRKPFHRQHPNQGIKGGNSVR